MGLAIPTECLDALCVRQTNRDHDPYGDSCDTCGSIHSSSNLDSDKDCTSSVAAAYSQLRLCLLTVTVLYPLCAWSWVWFS